MIVYRVEHRRTRVGPWSNTGTVKQYDQRSGRLPVHGLLTGPKEEGGPFAERFKREGGVFGFLSLDQIVEWFPSEDGRLAMAELGYILAVYETPDGNVGRNSVVFRHGGSKRLKTLDLVSLTEEEKCRSRKLPPVKELGIILRK